MPEPESLTCYDSNAVIYFSLEGVQMKGHRLFLRPGVTGERLFGNLRKCVIDDQAHVIVRIENFQNVFANIFKDMVRRSVSNGYIASLRVRCRRSADRDIVHELPGRDPQTDRQSSATPFGETHVSAAAVRGR